MAIKIDRIEGTEATSRIGSTPVSTAAPTPTRLPDRTAGNVPDGRSVDAPQSAAESLRSVEAFHSTIFERFELSAEPVYNFYVEDETTVPSPATGSLEDIPRYVKLRWKTAPERYRNAELMTKGRKTEDRSVKVVDRSGVSFSADNLGAEVGSKALANGFIAPGVIRARIEPPKQIAASKRFREELHLISDTTAGLKASDVRSNIGTTDVGSASMVNVASSGKESTSVSFVDPGIMGLFSAQRLDASSTAQHAAAVVSLSQIASSLEIVSEFNQIDPRKSTPPEFPAPADFLGINYVGYVIEKHLIHHDGSMALVESIVVNDPRQGELIDRDVVYGALYSYRIRSIVRWTRKKGVGFFGESSTDLSPLFLATAGPATHVCSFYGGDWSKWADSSVEDRDKPQPPDEVTVRPVSEKAEVHITWRIPYDPHVDLETFTILRKRRTSGIDASEWVELTTVPARNGIFIDREVVFIEDDPETDHVYAMTSTTVHGHRSDLSDQYACVLTRTKATLGEEPIEFVSRAGVPIDAHGQFATLPPRLSHEQLLASRRVAVSIREGMSGFQLLENDYVVRIRSLVTGELLDLPLTARTTDVGARRAANVSALKTLIGRNRRPISNG